MAVVLSPFAGVGVQLFDNNGVPLAGGKIFTYQAGTTTPQATYTTNVGNVARTNPIILDSAGRVPGGGEVWVTYGAGYKFVLTTSTDVPIATYDNVPSAAPPPTFNDADVINYEPGYTVTAGGFVTGTTYRILTIGNTDFTLIGATSNTVGLHFVATGAGTGTGTAEFSRTVESVLRQVISVKDFGAVGDGVADDTTAIQNAINWVSTTNGTAGTTIFFPSGLYKVTSTITVNYSGVALVGDNQRGVSTLSPLKMGGAQLIFASNTGGPILDFGTTTAYKYNNRLSHLRFGTVAGLSVKPIGVRMNACSEFSVKDCNFISGMSVGLALNTCFIGSVDYCDFATNDIHVDLYVDVTGLIQFPRSVWFSNNNYYNANDSAVRIRGSYSDLSFRDSWAEWNATTFKVVQQSNTLLDATFNVDNFVCEVSGAGPLNTRFIYCRAFDGGNQNCNVYFSVSNSTVNNQSATYNIEYIKGTNTGGVSYLNQAQISNTSFAGASTSVVYSDTSNSSIFVTGKVTAPVALVGANTRLHKMSAAFGFWDMVDSYPLRLPTVGAISFATEGQFYYQDTRRRLAFTANSVRILLPRPLVQTYGDEDVTVNVTDNAETLRFNTALSTNRTVTLSATLAYNGAKFRVFRTAAATGASTLSVGGLKTLAVGQWCDVEHDGSAWRLTAFGSL